MIKPPTLSLFARMKAPTSHGRGFSRLPPLWHRPASVALALALLLESRLVHAAGSTLADPHAPASPPRAAAVPSKTAAPTSKTADPTSKTTDPTSKTADPWVAERVLAALHEAEALAQRDPKAGAAALTAALAQVIDEAPAVAADRRVQDARLLAQLALARAHLAANDPEAATRALDDALRFGRGTPLPADQFGPGLAALHRQRAESLVQRGTGEIEIHCTVPCRVFLDGREASAVERGLLLGNYHLQVTARDAEIPPLRTDLHLARPGKAPVLHFPAAPTASAAEGTPAKSNAREARARRAEARASTSSRSRRLLPLYVEIPMLVLGAGATGAGAWLLAIDKGCVRYSAYDAAADPPYSCLELYETQAGGIAAVSLGASSLIAAAVLLGIDESRRRRSRSATRAFEWRGGLIRF